MEGFRVKVCSSFQFHIGSINNLLTDEDMQAMDGFQFHIGSINNFQTGRTIETTQIGFNSTLVQLIKKT